MFSVFSILLFILLSKQMSNKLSKIKKYSKAVRTAQRKGVGLWIEGSWDRKYIFCKYVGHIFIV